LFFLTTLLFTDIYHSYISTFDQSCTLWPRCFDKKKRARGDGRCIDLNQYVYHVQIPVHLSKPAPDPSQATQRTRSTHARTTSSNQNPLPGLYLLSRSNQNHLPLIDMVTTSSTARTSTPDHHARPSLIGRAGPARLYHARAILPAADASTRRHPLPPPQRQQTDSRWPTPPRALRHWPQPPPTHPASAIKADPCLLLSSPHFSSPSADHS
jgi:hypothetical protein